MPTGANTVPADKQGQQHVVAYFGPQGMSQNERWIAYDTVYQTARANLQRDRCANKYPDCVVEVLHMKDFQIRVGKKGK